MKDLDLVKQMKTQTNDTIVALESLAKEKGKSIDFRNTSSNFKLNPLYEFKPIQVVNKKLKVPRINDFLINTEDFQEKIKNKNNFP